MEGIEPLSHVNDSGLWPISRFFGMADKRTPKTWTVIETTPGWPRSW
jgi:H+/gluconate symporter-like permease